MSKRVRPIKSDRTLKPKKPQPDSKTANGRVLRPVGFFPDFCLKGYSEVYLPDLDSSVGIKSFSGIGNLEIKGKLLICHEGQVWDIRLTNGSHYSFQEGIGGTIYE